MSCAFENTEQGGHLFTEDVVEVLAMWGSTIIAQGALKWTDLR